ncbi:hypothetical protein [Streptomyces sp. NPDC048172]|uniref:hypothetical protein n=1 Tax=Streptomyces sp. NPDC048172 TaxID=3365505 RepID=UPI00371BE4CD
MREADLVEPLDAWLARAFAPTEIERSLVALQECQPDTASLEEAARRVIAECDRKRAQHRAALEAGADPQFVAQWSRAVQAERTAAHAQLRGPVGGGAPRKITVEEVQELIKGLGGMLTVRRLAEAQSRSSVGTVFVSGGGLDHYAHALSRSTRLEVG